MDLRKIKKLIDLLEQLGAPKGSQLQGAGEADRGFGVTEGLGIYLDGLTLPDEVYEQPANRFVAEFIGSVNLFDGVIDEDLPEYVTVRSPLFPAPIYIAHGITGYEGQPVAFALRPEKVMIGKDEPEGHTNKAQGVIEDIAYFGTHSVYHVRLPSGAKVLANFANSQRWASDGLTWGDEVWVHWRDNDGVVLTS